MIFSQPRIPNRPILGVTLVEVLVALALVGVAGSMFGYFITSLQSTKKAREQTTALAYARDYLEGLRTHWQTLVGYQTLSLATPAEPPASYNIKVNVQNDKGATIFSYPGGATATDLSALRNITLTFTDEQAKTVSLVTTIARPTPVPSKDPTLSEDN
jgi:prepilin-type N-terminal cleavage/methylation domain-containing protein